MILIDFNPVVVSNIFAVAKDLNYKMDIDIIRQMVLTSLRRYRVKFGKTHGELVICVDAKDQWRKKIFPYYKENRKKSKEASKMDWDVIGSAINQIATELYFNFPYKVISVDTAEADDAIAVICRERCVEEDIVIISGDKDLVQLQKYPNVSQYDPVRDRPLSTDNPARFLREHILRGDTSDGVPNFLSDDDVFMNPKKRQKSVYAKKLDVWLDDIAFFDTSEHAKNIKRNDTLINLDNVPQDIYKKVMRQYNKEPVGDRSMILGYFSEHGLSRLLPEIRSF